LCFGNDTRQHSFLTTIIGYFKSNNVIKFRQRLPLSIAGGSDSKANNVGLVIYSSYFLPVPSHIVRMIKSRRRTFAGHAACMGRRGMHIGFWWERHIKETTKET
jgi:hypothetical protein